MLVSLPVEIDLANGRDADRPKLSGKVQSIDTKHFRILYTLSGEDAVHIQDENGNTIPDDVEELGLALEHSWDVEINQLGWAPPPPDLEAGDDNRYDIYLEDLDLSIAGYTDRSHGLDSDNPRMTAIEKYAAASYIAIDNDFIEVIEEGLDISPLNFMRATAAHEFAHAIQFG